MDDNEHAIRAIRAAFADVKLGDGVGLEQAQGLDDYADVSVLADLRSGDEKDDWSRIPVEALNRCHSSLSFFDAQGMRFHLPAYLIAELRGDYRFNAVFSVTKVNAYKSRQFALLSMAQRDAVRAFLLRVADEPDHEFEHADIASALATYWVRHG